jgi:putative tryptophan/tyrosine transport system substrate-binding protein
MMKRRDFIMLLGSAAVAWPLAAGAQQGERVRRIGVFMNRWADDPLGQANAATFQQALQDLGWTEGKNLRADYRWRGEFISSSAAQLVKLAPDLILAAGSSNLAAVQQATRTIPIVFTNVTDPVGSGFVASLSRPGGNTTGVVTFEYSMSGKWLELLKEIAPSTMRAGVLRNPAVGSGIGQFSAIQSAAVSLSVELTPVDVREANEIERAIGAFARAPNTGLIVTSSAFTIAQRDLIITLAGHHRLPAIYPFRFFSTSGGLMSYGPNQTDQWRLASGYVDRILRGEKPADLPVQMPTRYELVINLKTAKALGLTIPDELLKLADEVIK